MLCFGFTSMGSGIGAMSIPPLLQFLLERYTWRGALLIFGGLVFHMCISAAVSTPLRSNCQIFNPCHQTKIKKTAKQKNRKSSVNEKEHTRKEPMEADDNSAVLKKCLEVMRNKSFLSFALSEAMTIASFNAVVIFIIDFYEANGINRSTSVLLYTIMNSTSALFRILSGFIVQIQCMPKLALPCCFMLVNSLALLLFPFAAEIAQYAVLALMLGVSIGGMSWAMPSTTFVLIGQEKYSTAFGLALTSVGISNVVAGPIAGKNMTLISSKGGLYLWSSMLIFSRKLFLYEHSAHFHLASHNLFSKKYTTIDRIQYFLMN